MLGISLALVGAGYLVLRALTVDYGAYPPAQVYADLFAQPPPPGVTDLDVSGHGFGMLHEVFMRFKATDAVMKSLTSDPTAHHLSSSESWQRVEGLTQGDDAFAREAHRLGWDTFPRSGAVECYELNTGGWYVSLVLERERHLVLVEATRH